MGNKYDTKFVSDRREACEGGDLACEGPCEYCDLAKNLATLLEEPTLFQAQLCRKGACDEGLLSVGKQSARAFYNSTDRSDWLRWMWKSFACEYPERWYRDAYGDVRCMTADEFRAKYTFDMLKAAEKARLEREAGVL